VIDRGRDELWSKVLQGQGLREIRLPLGRGVAGWVVAQRRLANIRDAYADDRFVSTFDKTSGFRTRAILCAPVLDRSGAAMGALQALNRLDGEPFDATDEAVLAAIAAQVSVALENARLLAAERRKNRELDLLYSLEGELASLRDPEAVILTVLTRAKEVSAAEGGALLVFEDDAAELFFHPTRAAPAPLSRTRVPLPPAIAGHAAEGSKTPQSRSAASPVAHQVRAQHGFQIQTACSAPVVCDGRLLGLLELYNPGSNGFHEDDWRLLALLGAQAGRALDRTRELTERERNERLRLLGQQLAGLMHDLRGPLSLILGNAELLAAEDDPTERNLESDTIVRQVDAVVQMMDEVLAYLRGESRVLTSRLLTDRFLAEVGEALQRDLTAHGIALRIDPGDLRYLRADEPKLRRALLNLGRNAVDAMPGGGTLTIAAKAQGSRALVSVSDSGEGIPEEIQPRVFETFFTHGKKGGTGLGLAFVRQVVEAHGGSVALTSAPGHGTTFTLDFPQ
jgi:signal transduction histidine kinase